MMLRIGLTGGIATGKSLAAGFFEKCGARLIDADVVAREVVAPGQDGWKRVVAHFGRDILDPEKAIDREKLGGIVFSDRVSREQLNRLLHPLIMGRINERLRDIEKQAPRSLVVVDVPLLIECGLQADYDRIVVVAADRPTQIKRLIQRSSLSERDAQARLDAQMNIDEKRNYADYVIENMSTLEALQAKVSQIYTVLMSDVEAKQPMS